MTDESTLPSTADSLATQAHNRAIVNLDIPTIAEIVISMLIHQAVNISQILNVAISTELTLRNSHISTEISAQTEATAASRGKSRPDTPSSACLSGDG